MGIVDIEKSIAISPMMAMAKCKNKYTQRIRASKIFSNPEFNEYNI